MSVNRLVLIDGHAVIYRAFYAYPPLNAPSGELVNAVYGFTSIVLNVIRELQPTHIALAFDLAKPTFRHKEFVAYKANRAETPQDLIDQVDRVKQVVEAFSIPIYTKEGYEADDVIGTIAKQVTKGPTTAVHQADARRAPTYTKASVSTLNDKTEVIIVTGDKDAFQLVDDDAPYGSVSVYVPGRQKQPALIYDEQEVEHRFEGLEPEQIVDLKGLAGDQSDNIPGVKGVGNKTAIKILLKYKTIEGVYGYIDQKLKIKDQNDLSTIAKDMGVGRSVVEKLLTGRESAFQSKKLATIIQDVPLDFKLKNAVVNDYDKKKVLGLFADLGFASLTHKLPNDLAEQNIQEALF